MGAPDRQHAAIMGAEGVSKKYGGFSALEDVNWSLSPGERRAIIGPNGAGKSTFINILSGLYLPTSGRIFYDSQDITSRSLHQRSRLGVCRTFQISNVFTKLSLLENVVSSLWAAGRRHYSLDPRRLSGLQDQAQEMLELVGLEKLASKQVSELSHGDRKRLELAMILALQPRVLLLDEPTAGMGMSERLQLVEIVEQVVERNGISLVFVEHDIDMVFRVAQRITVMNRGRIFAEGSASDIAANEAVQDIYLGKTATAEADAHANA